MVTRTEPGADSVQGPNVRYAADGIEAAMARAEAAVGDRNVLVHAAATAQLTLQAGVLDELEIHQVPVLLGAGRSLFGTLGSPRPLDLVRVIEAQGVSQLRYRVVS